MKITDPHQSYTLLWEALKANAQAVMYNFFNWPTLRHSRLIVLAVANTMDLPERTLSNKISSRLGLTHHLSGYTRSTHENHPVTSRGRARRCDPDDGSVRQPSRRRRGDARRALDICRRAVELAEGDAQRDPQTPSKSGSHNQARRGRVTIATVKRPSTATTNPVQRPCLPLMSKLIMAALLLRNRRTGLVETTFGDTLDELQRATAHSAPTNPGMAMISATAQRTQGRVVGSRSYVPLQL
ncbi:recognition complex subunit 1 [Hirsutella rhossiliensis]|uniref:Origin recognition complex subunit 1 n=1 Tax=Hirsutella rhossiliensis TaxID=111463 RepID=A0A9P8SDF1_9HYPO|nr:recognition complex subunit 1 [Hirsutella rhossiliensis]KAH0957275.1 recognition complex subunit 1 [Hirsutella rhossiliensis]